MDFVYCLEYLVAVHIFEQVAVSAGLQCAVDVFVTVIGRQHDNAIFGIFLANLGNGLDTTHSRHSQVHKGYVGPMLSKFLDRLLSIARLSNYLHTGFRGNNASKTLANYWVVVDDHY